MKKSWLHFSKDVTLFGIMPLVFTIPVGKFLIDSKYIDISDSLLSEVLQSFKIKHINSIIVILLLFSIVFSLMRYCLWIGYNRQLYSKNTEETLAYYLFKIAFATMTLTIFTIILTEKQFMIATGWLTFFLLMQPFFVLKNPDN